MNGILTFQQHAGIGGEKFHETNGTSTHDHATNIGHDARNPIAKERKPYDYGGNPLAHVATNNPDYRLTAFGGEFQPGLYRYLLTIVLLVSQ